MHSAVGCTFPRIFLLNPHEEHDEPIIVLSVTGFLLALVGGGIVYMTEQFLTKSPINGIAASVLRLMSLTVAASGLVCMGLGMLGYLLRAVAVAMGLRKSAHRQNERDAAKVTLRSLVTNNRGRLEEAGLSEIGVRYLEEPFEERRIDPIGRDLPADVQAALMHLFSLTVEEHLDEHVCLWESGSLTIDVSSGEITWTSEDISEHKPKERQLVYEPKPVVIL